MKTKIVPLIALITLSGCVLPPPDAPPPPRTISYQLPVFTPVDPDKQSQEEDGVRITVAPYAYATKETVHTEIQPLPTLFAVNNEYPAKLTEVPTLEVTPKEVRFKVTVYNHLERVVRMGGTAVAFSVAGKTIATDQSGYADFLNGIILPRQEGDYEIAGPDISTLPDNATIGLFLYDMVTATDAAGNPTKRSNFEFYYTLSRQDKTESVPVTVRRVMLDQNGRVIGNQ